MNFFRKYSLLSLVAFSVFQSFTGISCSSSENEKTNSVETPDHHHEELALSAAQIKAADIRIDTISLLNMHAVVRASGQLAVPPQNKADVNVLFGGLVRKILVQEGAVVHQGQVLALLENPDFIKLQENYLTAKRNFVFTTEEKQRQEDLDAAKAGTGKNLQQANANYQSQKAGILSLQKQLEQIGINPQKVEAGKIVSQVAIVAPINGTVGHININTGAYASPEKPLMEIIDNSKVHADLIVFEKDLFKVKTGQKVRFVLTNQNNQELKGIIYGINKSFEDETKGIIVHVAIQNPGRLQLIPGMYVTGLINVGNQRVQAIPEAGVVHSDEKDYIYVVDKDHSHDGKTAFRKVEVGLGVEDLGYVQIHPVEELPKGIRVVSNGAFYLLSSEKPAGEHSH